MLFKVFMNLAIKLLHNKIVSLATVSCATILAKKKQIVNIFSKKQSYEVIGEHIYVMERKAAAKKGRTTRVVFSRFPDVEKRFFGCAKTGSENKNATKKNDPDPSDKLCVFICGAGCMYDAFYGDFGFRI